MSFSLLSTKLYIPPVRAGAIARQRLTEKLLSGIKHPGSFSLLSGPAGFGKTTLLSEFVAQIQQAREPSVRVAWLSLDEGDSDPNRFWSYLIHACQSAVGEIGENALALLRTPQPMPVETIPTLLINDLIGQDLSLVLILDDFHTIRNEAIQASLLVLLDHLPWNLSLVVSMRNDPPWPLARYRARNQLIEIRARDLRFRPEEAAAFLNDTMDLSLSTDSLAALEERTEGWIAGLQLAALSMQGHSDISAFIQNFTGSHVYVAEYLVEEVLQHQPEEIQAFLLKTSILGRLSAGLCEAVTGHQDGQSVLVVLQRANLFVLPLDDESHWFRYHHLFADLLQARLKQTMPASEITGLHGRAAAWYEQNGFTVEAVEHALAARDIELAARLIEQNTYALVTRGELATLLRWIEALPAEVNRRPQFLLAKAWALLFAGDAAQIETLLGQMDAQVSPDPSAPFTAELLGSAAAIRAFFALMAGDHPRALQLAEQAEKALSPIHSKADQPNPFVYAARSVLPYTLGMAYRSQGKYEQAAQAFGQEIEMFTAPEDILGWMIATLEVAVVRRMQGRLRESEEICRRALQRIADLGTYPSGPLARVDLALGEVLREHNDLDEACRRVTITLERMRTWNMPTDRLAAQLGLLRIQVSQKDLPAARETLRAAKELRAGAPVFLDLSRSLDILEIRLAFLEQDVTSAATLLDALKPGSSQIVFLREQELLSLARLHLAQNRPGEALAALDGLAEDAESAGRLFAWLEIRVQQALALDAKGERQAALGVLQRILGFAAQEGFVRVFVDEGLAMELLLTAAARQNWAGPFASYLARLLDAFPAVEKPGTLTPVPSNGEEMIEPLTPRELEVLNLIAAGDSNQTIADRLVITVSAVKKHTGNIYGKLSVSSRTQAVSRARQLGLLTQHTTTAK